MESLRKTFAMITIDKTANNYGRILKSFYTKHLLYEAGITWKSNTKTYSKEPKFKGETVNANVNYLAKYELRLQINKTIHQLSIGFKYF